jgi:hypothetical protein
MHKYLAAILPLALAAALYGFPAAARAAAEPPPLRFDPALSGAAPPAPEPATDAPVAIEKGAIQTNLRLQTETPLSPYVGAERGPELLPAEQRLPPQARAGQGPAGHRLEAGIGLFVEDQASLNLGYRFHEPPSLLNERSTDPLTLSGDLRISFDLKMPF